MSSPNFLCSICFKPIISKDYQIDEQGWAVHKECYEQRTIHTASQQKKPKKTIWETWRRAG